MKGGDKHKVLVDYAKKRLMEVGVRILGYDAELEEGVHVDILGMREGKVIGLECYREIVPKYLKDRLRKLRSHVDQVIICVPDEDEAEKAKTLSSPDFNIEVWAAGLEVGYTAIRVSKELVRKLNEIRQEGEALEDVIERLLLYYKKKKKKEVRVRDSIVEKDV
jgi:predicted CopG family antitoxin